MKANFIKFILVALLSLNCGYSQWTQVGNEIYTAWSPSLKHHSNTPFMFYVDSLNNWYGTVDSLNSTNWINVGPGGCTQKVIASPDLEFFASTAYITFTDTIAGEYAISAMKFNGVSWDNVGSEYIDTNASSSSIASDGNDLYILYVEVNAPDTGLTLIKYNGSDWDLVGTRANPIDQSIWNNTFRVHSGVPYVVDFDGNILMHNGTDWIQATVPLPDTTSVFHDLEFFQDTLYITYFTSPPYMIKVKKYDGGNWLDVGNSLNMYGLPQLSFGNTIPFLAAKDQNGDVNVFKLNGNLWTQLGTAPELPNHNVSDYSFEVINEVPYVIIHNDLTMGYRMRVLRFTPGSGTEEEFFAENISIYPNPSKDYITVDLENASEKIDQLIIVSSTGQTVFTKMVDQSNSVAVNCSDLAPGIYFLKAIVSGKTIVKKIVISW